MLNQNDPSTDSVTTYFGDDEDSNGLPGLGKIFSPAPAQSLVPPMPAPAATGKRVSIVRDLNGHPAGSPFSTLPGPSRIMRPGLAGKMQQMMADYNASDAPAQYAASRTSPLTDMANPDPNASLRPAGTNPMPNLLPAGGNLRPAGSGTMMPSVMPAGPSQMDRDQAARDALVNQGPPVCRIRRPWLRALATVGDVAGSVLVPGAMQYIPKTTLNYQRNLGVANQNLANDQQQALGAATVQDTLQQAGQRAAKAKQDLADAQRDALRNPTPKEAELYNLDQDAQYRPSELGRLAIEANKGAKPDSVQGMYAAAVKDAMDRGVDPMKDPKVQQLQDAQTALHRPPATKAEQRDDRAIEILSKPPNQRTAGENAYLNGYNQWVKETKVAPGVERMQVLMNMPTAVADPTVPGGVKYVTRTDAFEGERRLGILGESGRQVQQRGNEGGFHGSPRPEASSQRQRISEAEMKSSFRIGFLRCRLAVPTCPVQGRRCPVACPRAGQA